MTSNTQLEFENLNFFVGKGDKQKHILRNVSCRLNAGHVLAVMGPSGAGKTTLINVLTLEAFHGTASGSVTLNGVPMTDSIFKKHCYVVKQRDKHWPYLTCREALTHAAELYNVAPTHEEISTVVSNVIRKTGLDVCADTKCARISGGQARRLSIAHALLKRPSVLFFDEPTSGLDSASAASIMQEIVRVAKDEKLIIICTIHQPSTKVYNGFDQVMVLSKGREAFTGEKDDAIQYFESIGCPCPPSTNPAEFFLDLVNSDFSDNAAVEKLLDTWEEHRSRNSRAAEPKNSVEDASLALGSKSSSSIIFAKEMRIIFHRQIRLIIRDPILYIGRCVAFLFTNAFFSFIYWNARPFEQHQVPNKMWICIWYCAVSTNLGVVAVYALNDEFNSITREAKNGMITGLSYVMAKNILVLPIILAFSVFSLAIPAFGIMDFPIEAARRWFFLWSAMYFVFESFAELMSIVFDDAIMGMLAFMNFYFASFLFSGFVIPEEDLYYPWTLFYHIMPFSYYGRSSLYEAFSDATFETCPIGARSAVCIQEETEGAGVSGVFVLEEFGKIIPLAESEDTTIRDTLILVAIGLVYKILYTIGVVIKTRRTSTIHEHSSSNSEKELNRKKLQHTESSYTEYERDGINGARAAVDFTMGTEELITVIEV